jgi:hypothetical protein
MFVLSSQPFYTDMKMLTLKILAFFYEWWRFKATGLFQGNIREESKGTVRLSVTAYDVILCKKSYCCLMSKISLYISAGEILRVSSSFFCFKVKYPVFYLYKDSFSVSCVEFCRMRSVVVNDVLRGMCAKGSRILCYVMSQVPSLGLISITLQIRRPYTTLCNIFITYPDHLLAPLPTPNL